MNALTRAWLEVQGTDEMIWAAAAAALPDGVWTKGSALLSGDDPTATFKRTGHLVDARIEHDGIGYAMIGASATLNVSVRVPHIVKDALPGKVLHSVIDTPITRVENANIVTSHAFRGSVDRILVVAVAPLENLLRRG